MTDILAPSGVPSAATPKAASRQRDEVFWTELEIRRLSNLVAEHINARRYTGSSASAAGERRQMRVYIDAMKRKAMRVLHRAELHVEHSETAEWPGIDPTISDPVSLAYQYVSVVEDYLAVLSTEEDKVAAERATREPGAGVDGGGGGGVGGGANAEIGEPDGAEPDDWEAADDVAYRDALKREREAKQSESQNRDALFGGTNVEVDGIRRRKGDSNDTSSSAGGGRGSAYSKEDEELMARQRPVQEELMSTLVGAVGQLKESVTENKEHLDKDKKVLDEAEEAVDKNLSGMSLQRNELKKYTQSTSTSWWVILIAALVIIAVFVLVLLVLSVPM